MESTAVKAETRSKKEFVSFGPVHLSVVDVDRSAAWWHDLIGLQQTCGRDGSVELGVGDEPLVVLHPGATSPVRRGHSGLYHLAIYPPSEAELARVLARVLQSSQRLGATDHAVAKSIYVNDPDGIGLEIAVETPERVRSVRWPETATQPEIIGADGRRLGGVEPLDVEKVLQELPDTDISRPLPPGTKVGHLNLHVPDLAAAYGFYRDRLGFLQSNCAPLVGFGDLGAGIPLTHRIAVNTWQGEGAPPPPQGTAGMDHFTIRFDTVERLQEVLSRLDDTEQRADGHLAHDPAGNAMVLTS